MFRRSLLTAVFSLMFVSMLLAQTTTPLTPADVIRQQHMPIVRLQDLVNQFTVQHHSCPVVAYVSPDVYRLFNPINPRGTTVKLAKCVITVAPMTTVMQSEEAVTNNQIQLVLPVTFKGNVHNTTLNEKFLLTAETK